MSFAKSILSIIVIQLLWLPLLTAADSFTYVYPGEGSDFASGKHLVLLRASHKIDPASLSDAVIRLTGSKSCNSEFELRIAADNQSLNLIPKAEFMPGESVTLDYRGGLRFADGRQIAPYKYTYKIGEHRALPRRSFGDLEADFGGMPIDKRIRTKSEKAMDLPGAFPKWRVVESNDPQPGYIFTTVFNPHALNWYPDLETNVSIIDNYGTQVFCWSEPSNTINGVLIDFKMVPDGNMIFAVGGQHYYLKMNKKFEVIDTLRMVNGLADAHDCLELENGHRVFCDYNYRYVDLTDSVEGGHPMNVINARIQEQDADGNVIFDWNGFGHIFIDEYMFNKRTDWANIKNVDLAHINAVEADSDTTFLLSLRHTSYICRVNKNTGNIMWKLGGGHGNQFLLRSKVPGESPLIFAQHDVRRLPNGNITVYDNGVYGRDPEYSRYAEFEVDEEYKVATLVRVLRSQPNDIFGLITGSSRHLDDGSIVVGWGSGRPNITEFKPDGTPALTLDADACIYRAVKYDFKNEIFDTDKDTLQFGDVATTVNRKFVAFNRTDRDIIINNFLTNTEDFFALADELPRTIPAGGSAEFTVEMTNDGLHTRDEIIKDVATFCSDTDSTRISFQVNLCGVLLDGSGVVDMVPGFEYSAWPQPANEEFSVRIKYHPGAAVRMEMYDIMGNHIETLHDGMLNSGELIIRRETGNYSNGIYILRITTDEGTMSRRVLIGK
ncbi:MAG: aryl-sulfate sulfotransferase [Candidatus Kapaibacterium sp.]